MRNLAHPIEKYVNHDSFKVYMFDTGMLNSLLGSSRYGLPTPGRLGITWAPSENAVAKEFRKCEVRLRYYGCSNNAKCCRMELDFI